MDLVSIKGMPGIRHIDGPQSKEEVFSNTSGGLNRCPFKLAAPLFLTLNLLTSSCKPGVPAPRCGREEVGEKGRDRAASTLPWAGRALEHGLRGRFLQACEVEAPVSVQGGQRTAPLGYSTAHTGVLPAKAPGGHPEPGVPSWDSLVGL